MKKKRTIITVLGARPQFIKAASVSRALRALGPEEGITETIVHTGQHYDQNMSAIFFEELKIPEPAVNLGVGSGPHGWQTGQMLARVESVFLEKWPDLVIVYGDTNSTLAGALAAAKLHIPVAHMEAGVRSFNKSIPEEINRLVVDNIADLLYCPSAKAVSFLADEGITKGVHDVGDILYESILFNTRIAQERSTIFSRLADERGDVPLDDGYYMATIHRPDNTEPARLAGILEALASLDHPVVMPLHPRTSKTISERQIALDETRIIVLDPVSYLDSLALESGARVILTDSGGMQKESYYCGVPCVTFRHDTEWWETVELGWNILAGADPVVIRDAVDRHLAAQREPRDEHLYGDGNTTEKIVTSIFDFLTG